MAKDNFGISDNTDYLNRIPEIAEMASTTLEDVFSSADHQRVFCGKGWFMAKEALLNGLRVIPVDWPRSQFAASDVEPRAISL